MEWNLLSIDKDVGQQELHPLLLAPESDVIILENNLALPTKIELLSVSHSVVSDSLWPHDYTIYEILQAWILEWVAVPFFRGSSQPRDQTWVSCIVGRFFTSWATREAPSYYLVIPHSVVGICFRKAFAQMFQKKMYKNIYGSRVHWI